MAKVKGAVKIDIEKCKGCEICIVSCPFEVLQLAKQFNTKGYQYAYMNKPEECTGCANCGIVCPDGVITVYRIKQE
jgi:2-oxoglutarate ferredoxin oxidoreductase subunit delta